MTVKPLSLVFLGLSISSSWGNGHATNYRALLKALAARGHEVTFLERDCPWYASNRDLPDPGYCRLEFYESLEDLQRRHARTLADADAVVVGSYVPEGAAVLRFALATARGLVGFYDIDTPITLAKLATGDAEYLTPEMIPDLDFYLSFTGGPVLQRLQRDYGARLPVAFYCMVDPELYRATRESRRWDLGYIGTYAPDRQPALERLLLEPARRLPECRFVVAGPQYPEDIDWPANVERIEHLPPGEHARFYSRSRFTLNITRSEMVKAGWSPSVRLFEAAACDTAILTDRWPGLDSILPEGRALLAAESADDVVAALTRISPARAAEIAACGRQIVLTHHTGGRRAEELEVVLARAGAASVGNQSREMAHAFPR